MSSFADVRSATCQVMADDGTTHNGTAFCVLDGYLLTCHHVVFGLRRIQVRFPLQPASVEARYVAALSNPAADVAVLQVAPGSLRPIQIAPVRDGPDVEVYGYGYRPSTLTQEPNGHTFSGRLGPGQVLQFPISTAARGRVAAIPAAERGAWNDFAEPFRTEECRNLDGATGLEPGISGGPVYDPGLRKVTGIFRAVEGDARAYVIPLDTVLTHWAQLLADNAGGVGDAAIDQLHRDFDVKPVSEGAMPRTAVLRRRFDTLFAQYQLFGGRARELDALNRFAADSVRRFFFVTGYAGFGKSALLANWIATLKAAPNVVYHFLSKTVENSLDAEFCFANLCEQMMAFHGLGGDLPDAFRLPDLYRQLLLLPPPPGQRLLIVVDGLDEALGHWNPGPSMFPPNLPEGVQIVFSAREIADRDWVKSLKLELDNESILRLSKLDRHAIDDVVASLKISSLTAEKAASLADRLWELSQGDAFYLQDLLADLATGKSYDPAQLAAYPIGHNEYLKLWWQGAEVDNKGFKDFMGLLAVARDSLTKPELVAISPTDELDEWNIDAATGKAARYIVGTEAVGYRLSHARIQEFIEAKLGASLATYGARFVEYCEAWEKAGLDATARRYVLRYGVRHLMDADAYDPLFQLLDAAWIAAKWRDLGSYAGLMDDLNGAARLALHHTDIARVAGAAILRATVRTVMAQIHATVLVAMTRFGGASRVIGMMRTERGIPVPTRSSGALIEVAAEMLRAPAAPVDSPTQVEITEFALTLLLRAFRMALDSGQIAVEGILQAILSAPALDEQRQAEFLEQMRRVALARPYDPALCCPVFGLMAQAAAKMPAAGLLAQNLLSQADLIAADLHGPDRFAADAALIPARVRAGNLDPAEAVRAALGGTADRFASSRYVGVPLVMLLDALPWEAAVDRAAAVALLREIGAQAQTSQRVSLQLASSLVRLLCRLGAFDDASGFINEIAATNPALASAAVVESAREIRTVAPDGFVEWLEWAASTLPPVAMARGWAAAGEWERALQALADVHPMLPPDRAALAALVRSLIGMVETTLPALDPATLTSIVRRLLDIGRIDPRNRVEQLATAARALAAADPAAARAYLDQAVALQLGEFPSGDLDRFRRFLALALAQDGKVEQAVAVVGRIASAEIQLGTIADLLVSTPASERAALDLYCGYVREFSGGTGVGGGFAALRAGLALLSPLRERCPDAGAALLVHLQSKSRPVLEKIAGVFEGFAQNPRNLWTMGWPQFADLADLVGCIAGVLPAEAQAVLLRLEKVAAAQPPPGQLRVKLVYARSLPDSPDNIAALRKSVADCLQHDASAPPSDDWLAIAPTLIGPAIARLSRAGIEDAATFLQSLLAVILRIRVPAKLVSASYACWNTIADCDSALLHRHPEVIGKALAAISSTLLPGDPRTGVIGRALDVLTAGGEMEAAGAYVAALNVPAEREFATSTLSSAEKMVKLGKLTPLEQAFLSPRERSPFAKVVFEKLRAGEDPKETFDTLTGALANDQILSTREGVLDANVWLLLLPLYRLSGSASIASMIDAIDDFDGRFRQAAALLSSAS